MGFVGLGVLLSVTIFILSATGTARFVPVLSDSMAPDMPVGSMAFTSPVPQGTITAGDVIVFSNPNQPSMRVIHRVTHVFSAEEAMSFSNWAPKMLFATTKGDNNANADSWVVAIADPTVWRLQASVPLFGQPAIWLAQPLAPLWLILVVTVVGAGWLLRTLWRTPRSLVGEEKESS